MRIVRDRLLTPVGLRSLAPGDPDFKPQYFGDLRARDAAYHQGTVWAWLVGPVRRRVAQGVPGRSRRARGARSTASCRISTMRASDRSAKSSTREPPFTPRGCIAQAWSVAEVLRVWVKLAHRAQHPWQPRAAAQDFELRTQN